MADIGYLDVENIVSRLLEVRGKKFGTEVQLEEREILGLCHASREIFLGQPMLLELEAPVRICGDIHGQYNDLLRLFEMVDESDKKDEFDKGFPPAYNYLFLGDYVDRGKNSLETICLLLGYKILYPENFFLLRGNHETSSINRVYGFFDECKRRYSVKLWKTFTDCFNCLPVAATIEDKIFCCHGGLSPDLVSMENIKKLPRPTDVPDTGLLCDLLWADPDKDTKCWGNNDRGVSFKFGHEIVTNFLRQNDFDLICRAHQVVEDGYEFFAKRQLVTVFSAPNYCGEFDNAGAMMSVNDQLMCHFHVLKPVKKKLKYTYSTRTLNEPMEKRIQNLQNSTIYGRTQTAQEGPQQSGNAKQRIKEKQENQKKADVTNSEQKNKEKKKQRQHNVTKNQERALEDKQKLNEDSIKKNINKEKRKEDRDQKNHSTKQNSDQKKRNSK
ncbi:hypothetical protein L9F63_013636, partial [Diploptera punctata]